MQLVEMVKEQYSNVCAARSAGDAATLLKAQHMFSASLATEASTAAPAVQQTGAAAIFYPRASSKDGIEMPHECARSPSCCNSPGKGYGTLLLQHIEQFVMSSSGHITAGKFFGMPAGMTAAAADLATTGIADSAANSAPAAQQATINTNNPNVKEQGGAHRRQQASSTGSQQPPHWCPGSGLC